MFHMKYLSKQAAEMMIAIGLLLTGVVIGRTLHLWTLH
jgi:hypothetical protein